MKTYFLRDVTHWVLMDPQQFDTVEIELYRHAEDWFNPMSGHYALINPNRYLIKKLRQLKVEFVSRPRIGYNQDDPL